MTDPDIQRDLKESIDNELIYIVFFQMISTHLPRPEWANLARIWLVNQWNPAYNLALPAKIYAGKVRLQGYQDSHQHIKSVHIYLKSMFLYGRWMIFGLQESIL